MSARYFMDLSEVFAAGYGVSDVKTTLGECDAGGSFIGLQQWSGDIYYFTVDFTGTAIHPGDWNLCEKEAVVQITSPVQGGMSNDWSYQEITGSPDYDCKTFLGKTAYIPVYDNGVLLWGEEPPGGAATAEPTPTAAPASTVTPVSTAITTPIPGELTGDVDSSGTVDIVDALLVAQYYVGLDPQNFNTNVADVNGDGSIDIVDALRIAQYYVGLIDEF